MAREKKANQKKNNGANVGYEAELWQMADALRGSMDAAEYKHVVLGLIFLKYISDAFEEQHAKLEAEKSQGADPEDPDEYRALSIFWVPPEARWSYLKSQAKQPKIGELVDNAMAGIERDNPSLKGVLPKDYARPGLDKQRLGQIIDMISNVRIGDTESRSKDILGRIYEYAHLSNQSNQLSSGPATAPARAAVSPGGWLHRETLPDANPGEKKPWLASPNPSSKMPRSRGWRASATRSSMALRSDRGSCLPSGWTPCMLFN